MEDGIFPKLKYVNFYMTTAHEAAKMSHAKRLQVGAVIVKDNRIVSYGYNGTPAGFSNVCEDEDGKTKSEVLHAESNALLKAAASPESTAGAGLYLTHSPCMDCAKMIVQANLGYVVFNEKYRDDKGIKFLQDMGIATVRWMDLMVAQANGLME